MEEILKQQKQPQNASQAYAIESKSMLSHLLGKTKQRLFLIYEHIFNIEHITYFL